MKRFHASIQPCGKLRSISTTAGTKRVQLRLTCWRVGGIDRWRLERVGHGKEPDMLLVDGALG